MNKDDDTPIGIIILTVLPMIMTFMILLERGL